MLLTPEMTLNKAVFPSGFKMFFYTSYLWLKIKIWWMFKKKWNGELQSIYALLLWASVVMEKWD